MINSTVDNTLTNGITLYNSDSNTVSNNYASKSDHGIFLNTCKNNLLQNNKVPNNLYGIAMRYSHNNRVINNNADGNKRVFTSHGKTVETPFQVIVQICV